MTCGSNFDVQGKSTCILVSKAQREEWTEADFVYGYAFIMVACNLHAVNG